MVGGMALLAYLDGIGRIERIGPDEEIRLARVIQDGLAAEQRLAEAQSQSPGDTVGAARSIPTVGERQDRRLAAEGRAAHRVFVEANLRLVVAIAKWYRHTGVEFEDLVQEGNLGLMIAARKFDPDKGFRFSTYATWWIRKYIDNAVKDLRSTIRLPRHRQEVVNRIEAARHDLTATLGRMPTESEVMAEACVTTADDIVSLRQVAQIPVSLDQTILSNNETVGTLGEAISDTGDTAPDVRAEANDLVRQVRDAIASTLSQDDAELIEMRFALDGRMSPAPVSEVARRQRVRCGTVNRRQAVATKKLAVALSDFR